METINTEEKKLDEIMRRLELFTEKVKALCEYAEGKKLKKWYDNQDVCLRLNISLRTLQTLRNNGTLPYTQINRKMFYRPEDVEVIVLNTKTKKNEQYE